MKYNYAFEMNKENKEALVKVVGRDLNISTKQAIEICSFIKKMPLKKARNVLERVEKKKLAIPFKRFTEGAGHKRGMSAGKYPVLASKQFLKLLKALEANAQNKGLSPELRIIHACAQQAPRPFHYGRKRRIKMKRTHVELIAEEMEFVKKEEKKEKAGKKAREEGRKAEKRDEKKVETQEDVKKELPEKSEKKAEEKKEIKKETKKVEVKKVEGKKEPEKKREGKEADEKEVRKENLAASSGKGAGVKK